jgi:hypothetical protein
LELLSVRGRAGNRFLTGGFSGPGPATMRLNFTRLGIKEEFDLFKR